LFQKKCRRRGARRGAAPRRAATRRRQSAGPAMDGGDCDGTRINGGAASPDRRGRSRVFFTAGYRAVYHGNRRYRWGTVTVPSGRNPPNSNLNLNSKNEKINKNHQKIVHDL
jgi:hypothetical protein